MLSAHSLLVTCRRLIQKSSCLNKVPRMGRNHYPERLPSIDETAQRLGFEKGTDMYPDYPLDEPPKLWMVTQIHKLKFRPYWEKEAMKDMGLYKVNDISVQMNTANNNEKLWQVKHLIRIHPIQFPNGLPTKEDIGGTHLKSNGELIIFKRLENPENENVLAPELKQEQWKVVDGYRMCNNCSARRCIKLQMCQKLWRQRGRNHLEKIGPKMFNYVDPPEARQTSDAEGGGTL
ncbi:uncharacterized protein LOC120341062 [Styela clava]